MSVRGVLAPLSNGETGVALSTSSAAQSAPRPGEQPTLAQLAVADADRLRLKQSEKKRQWRQSRSEQQLRQMRQRDAERKRVVRDMMSLEQKRLEREKDARRKAMKRQREKDNRRRVEAMSISRILNPAIPKADLYREQ